MSEYEFLCSRLEQVSSKIDALHRKSDRILFAVCIFGAAILGRLFFR